MTSPTIPGLRLLATAFGVLMVAAGGVPPAPVMWAVTALAGAAVLAGVVFRPAATVAVLTTIVAVVLCDPPPALAALSGLSAVCYLLLRYASGSVAPVTRPIVVGALGFSMIGWSAAAIPAEFTRLPVVAPLALVALYVLVTRPFVPHLRSGGRGGGGLTRS